jgi:hypothetical protein
MSMADNRATNVPAAKWPFSVEAEQQACCRSRDFASVIRGRLFLEKSL